MSDMFDVQDPVAVEMVAVSGVPVVTTAYGLVAGPPGPPGGSITGRAGAAVGGHRAVAWGETGEIVHASNTDPDQVGALIGVAIGAVMTGGAVTVATAGVITEASWSWTVHEPVWCGVDGALTQVVPVGGAWVQRVGWAVTGTALYISVGPPTVTS